MVEEGQNGGERPQVLRASKWGKETSKPPVESFSDIHKRIMDEDTDKEERKILQKKKR